MTFSAIRVATGQGLRIPVLIGLGFVIQDQKNLNIAAGSSSAGVNTRDLNTEIVNTITGAFLGTNQFTLPSGTYEITAKAPSINSGVNRIYLYNVTDASEELLGTSDRTNSPAGAFAGGGIAWLRGRFTILAQKTFEIRHQIELAQSTNGFGVATNDLVNKEIYTQVAILEVT